MLALIDPSTPTGPSLLLYVIPALVVAIGFSFLPGIRRGPKFLIAVLFGWLLLGPAWDSFFMAKWPSKLHLLHWHQTDEDRALIAKAENQRKELNAYARIFLKDTIYVAYSTHTPIRKTAEEKQTPDQWERFEKGLKDVNPEAGPWTNRRVFEVGVNTMQRLAFYEDERQYRMGTANHLPENDPAFAGFRRCLSPAQVTAVYHFLTILDPKNSSGFNAYYEKAMLVANDPIPSELSERTFAAPESTVADNNAPSVSVRLGQNYTGDKLSVSVIREVGTSTLYAVVTPDGVSHQVLAKTPDGAKALLKSKAR